ncbi:MAG: DUF354 domain-containing protein [Candidatus Heimdallarchaeota archaeon]|nr:DUF354 domain-containing protein [Candidatus Heimdallarchaeota archaeon]
MVDNKVVWFEVLTPKQAMLFIAIGEKLRTLGFQTIYTTRKHDYIHDIFDFYHIVPISLGKYGGKTLEEKLLSSAERVVELSKVIINNNDKPFMTISFSSPDASRVAFGLAIPLIILNDTSHSKPVARLTFSLAKYLITPSCINKNDFIELGANPNIIHTYNGVDEVEYISGENYSKYLSKRTNNKERYLVFRPEESFAAYMKDTEQKTYLNVLEDVIKSYSGKIIVLPRYDEQTEIIQEQFEGKVEIPNKGIFLLDLLAGADAVITGGGTIGREAALCGIPSVTYFWRHLEPQKFIEDLGFPSHSVQTLADTKKLVKKICPNPNRFSVDTSKMINKLEKPSDILLNLMKKDKQFKDYFK